MIRKFGWKALAMAAKFVSKPLHKEDLEKDPYVQFDHWYQDAVKGNLPEPTAMALATVGADGLPSQRMVLMKGISAEGGVVFYTNYNSRKAGELDAHGQAAALFHYHIFQRQIRFAGKVERVSREESEAYFRTRPRDSQLGAWASLQSQDLPNRETFEARCEEMKKKFDGGEIPCPEHWGGYRIKPEAIEFWQGRAYRLHDRFVYTPQDNGSWDIRRLYP